MELFVSSNKYVRVFKFPVFRINTVFIIDTQRQKRTIIPYLNKEYLDQPVVRSGTLIFSGLR